MPVSILIKRLAALEVVRLGITGLLRFEVVQIRDRCVLPHQHPSLEPVREGFGQLEFRVPTGANSKDVIQLF